MWHECYLHGNYYHTQILPLRVPYILGLRLGLLAYLKMSDESITPLPPSPPLTLHHWDNALAVCSASEPFNIPDEMSKIVAFISLTFELFLKNADFSEISWWFFLGEPYPLPCPPCGWSCQSIPGVCWQVNACRSERVYCIAKHTERIRRNGDHNDCFDIIQAFFMKDSHKFH